ncbi:MAG: hypothetical protein WCD11_27740 [Solirubrobacteraceae bacterium]
MPSNVTEVESEVLQRQIIPQFLEMLGDKSSLSHPAQLEHLAATLLIPLEQPEIPAEVGAAVVRTLEARRDATSAGVLAALGGLAAQPLADQAREGVRRLAEEGVESPSTSAIGTLMVGEAMRIEHVSGEAEVLAALLVRDDGNEVQAAIFGIEHRETGGALVECVLAPPAPVDEARDLFDALDGAAPPQPIDPQELTRRVIAAAHRSIKARFALSADAGPALPIISRTLTGDPHGIPRPDIMAPSELDDPELVVDAAEDEREFQRLMDLLLDELEQYVRANVPPESAAWQHGDFIATTMLQWKGGYDDGRLGRWTSADLAEYLLDYFPRKVTVDPETLDAVPECVKAFLAFMQARGSLSGEAFEVLEQALDALGKEFKTHAQDNSRWGLAKSMFMQMQTDGVDPSQPDAIDAWMGDFNSRPREERDAIIGPAADRMAETAGIRRPNGNRAPKPKTQPRRAQKAARRRNRRR